MQTTQLALMRIGFTQDKASGEHSALMLKALTEPAQMLVNEQNMQFYQSLLYLMVDEFSRLRPDLIWQVLHHLPREQWPTLTPYEYQCISAFIDGKRQYSDCVVAIHKLLLLRIPMQQCCTEEAELLIAKVFQKQSNAQICKLYRLTGKKMLTERLKHFVANL